MDVSLVRRGRSSSRRFGGADLLAWVASLALHGLILAGMYRVVLGGDRSERVVIIPEARLAPADLSASPVEPVQPLELSREPIEVIEAQNTISPPEELPIAVAGAGGMPVMVLPPLDVRAPDARREPLTTPVTSSGVPTGPVSSFFGQAGNAYTVVYVVDLSASLMTYYADDIIRELRQSVQSLVPTQKFHIVLAKPMEVDEFEPRRLVPAIAQYKQKALAFIDQIGRTVRAGAADPIEAMRRAFAAKPQLIYFLTDGEYRNLAEELELALAQLNQDRAVKITVIGFVPLGEGIAAGNDKYNPVSLLRRIAETHGGHFRMVEFKE